MLQHDFILLDRSGSMADLWQEALGSINGYVEKLAKDNVDTGVTLAAFDLIDEKISFDLVRDRITPSTWKTVTDKDACPRGSTPLNDAIGKIVTLAREGINGVQYGKVALIIMTDGYENASREYTHAAAKALLDDCRVKGWQVVFLGANFDNAAQAQSYGTAARQTVRASKVGLGSSMSFMASKRATYGATGQAINFTDEEKAAVSKE